MPTNQNQRLFFFKETHSGDHHLSHVFLKGADLDGGQLPYMGMRSTHLQPWSTSSLFAQSMTVWNILGKAELQFSTGRYHLFFKCFIHASYGIRESHTQQTQRLQE